MSNTILSIRFNLKVEYYRIHQLPDVKPHLTAVSMVRLDLGRVTLKKLLRCGTECMTNIVKYHLFNIFNLEIKSKQLDLLLDLKPHLTGCTWCSWIWEQ